MLQRDFYSYEAFREAIGADDESIRQALIRGELKAYLEPKQETARFRFLSLCFGVRPSTGSNKHCAWQETKKPFPEARDDYYILSGWFRVDDESLREAARNGAFRAAPMVIPPIENDGLLSDGDVFDFSVEVEREYEGSYWIADDCTFLPNIKDLWFDSATVRSLQQVGAKHADAVPSKPMKLRADREENLLRVIAGLWALSGLPPEHNATADKLSALFASWRWDKPAASTMADTILKEAANLPGASIRS